MLAPNIFSVIDLGISTFVYIADDFEAHMHNASIVISTHKRADGSLIHNTTQGQHDMCEKVPDYELVGLGKWEYSK